MPGLAPLLTAALAGAATPANPPALDGQWCADVTETLTVDGVKEPMSTNAYNLCLDTTGIRWSQAQAPEGAGYSIFNGTDFWGLFPDASLPGGYNCTHKHSGREDITMMPYRMVTIDASADLNKTETYDGVKNVQNWYHYRPGSGSGPVQYAAEQMHWHVAPLAADGSTRALLASEAVEVSQFKQYAGRLQHGVRDFSSNRTKFIERKLPNGVKCTEAPAGPHDVTTGFKSMFYK